ncbi:hypothetical protein Aph01nite_13230 [Acrocarpospora phusangensis]|uniref:Phage portal protein n=1 Tax=Acrocarpospora phusangensis TaxID=1070424 RepID=A0A919UM80_9ACTN|nr:phage portal protein [Acrocarpospora phusangensis]GIH23013.1 hypothetical protein Aph01nite_13230 [Acrocarpospora phusangensis]
MSALSLRNPLDAARPANKAPVPYVSRSASSGFLGMAATQTSDAVAHMTAYGTNGTLFAIVDANAQAVASATWRLYRKAKSGLKEDRVEVTSHLALDLLAEPNDFFTGFEFREAISQHLQLTGEGWWVISRDERVRSIPLEIWPVRPDRMAPVPSREKFIAGYVYTGPDGEKVPLELDEVVFMRLPNPLDPYRGLGPVQAILTDLDSARYGAQWNRNFFLNSAEPGGIIEFDEGLDDEEFEQLRERWDEQHRGVSRAHRVALLERGKWKDRKFTMRDMQFTELSELSDEKVRKAFRFPKPLLGSVDDVNRANAEAGEVVFSRWLVNNHLTRWRSVLNARYLPLFGATAVGLELDFDDPVPPDAEAQNAERESKATAAKTYVDAGYTGDSVKAALDLPDSLVWEKRSAPPAALPPGPAPVTPEDVLARARATWARVPRRRRPRAAADDDQEEARADWEQLLDELLSDWAEVSAAQREALAEQIEEIVNSGDPERLAELTVPTEEAAAVLTAAMMVQAYAAQQRMAAMAEEAGEDVEAIDPAEEDGPLAEALAAAALLIVLLLASALATLAARLAWWFWSEGESGESVAEEVDEQLAALKQAELRRQLGWALWQAEGEARWEILARMDWDYLEAVEEDDTSTCRPCGIIDGKRFTTIEDARRAYPKGGHVYCLGQLSCRGNVEPRWEAPGGSQEGP